MSNLWPLCNAHPELLLSTINDLPAKVLERYPVLRVFHPMTPVVARTAPYKPLGRPDDNRDRHPDELDATLLGQMIAARQSGDISAAQNYASRLERRLAEVTTEGRTRTEGPMWFMQLQIGSTHLMAGESSQALLEFATARQLGRLSQQQGAERFALARIALAHAARGSIDDAEAALTDGRRLPEPSRAAATAVHASERTAAALIAVDRLSENLEQAISDLEPYDTVDLSWPFALLARTRALLAWKRPHEALEVISLTQNCHPIQDGSFAADVIAAKSIDAHLAIGDEVAAHRILKSTPLPGILTRFAAVIVALREGNHVAATTSLRRIAAQSGLSPQSRAKHLLLSGWSEFARTGSVDPKSAAAVARLATVTSARGLWTIAPESLVEAVKEQLPPEAALKFAGALAGVQFSDLESRPSLTASELRVLSAMSQHMTTAQIAAAFYVSPNTIKTQLRSLYRKLGCSSREEAIAMGARFRLDGVSATLLG